MGASAKRKEERAQKYGHLRSVFTEEAITTSSKDRSQLQPESESSNEENAGDSFSGISSDRNENAREEELGKLDTAAKCAAPPRFICFVGNLPYSATEASVKRHFASTKPISTRLGTNKETGRCRGFAFLEYESRTAQQACLLSFHHTHFLDTEKQLETSEGEGEAAGSAQRDEEKEGRGWRRINVELTAGGGGRHSDGRKVRLKAKNDRLNKQRARRAARLVQRQAEKAGSGKENTNEGDDQPTSSAGNVHPSRISRVQKT